MYRCLERCWIHCRSRCSPSYPSLYWSLYYPRIHGRSNRLNIMCFKCRRWMLYWWYYLHERKL
jgi:hypothetical protein